jgi:hypothetical protein
MSARDSSNAHEVIGKLFRAMNTKIEDRAAANLLRWANLWPTSHSPLRLIETGISRRPAEQLSALFPAVDPRNVIF